MHTDPQTDDQSPARRRSRRRPPAPPLLPAARASVAVLALATVALITACEPVPPPFCNGIKATITGTPGSDVLTGTPGTDVIHGLGGNDKISGLAGHDLICGGAGNDTLTGGEGPDGIEGGPGADTIAGGPGADLVSYRESGAAVVVDLRTGKSNDGDRITETEDLFGSPFADTLTGNDAANQIYGHDGGDRLVGAGGNDRLIEERTPATDTNRLLGGPGDDVVVGGVGRDVVSFESSAAPVVVDLEVGVASGEGSDRLFQVDAITGSNGNDTLIGSSQGNAIDGRGGNDVIDGGPGDDTLDGGAGQDRATWANALTRVRIDLAAGVAGSDGTDRLRNIEDLTGSPYDDALFGTTGPNVIDGDGGYDDCLGAGGADTFVRCE